MKRIRAKISSAWQPITREEFNTIDRVVKPAKRDIDQDARSHAGVYGDFEIGWFNQVIDHQTGWYVVTRGGDTIGPFHTSQAAFGAAKDAIDQLIAEGK